MKLQTLAVIFAIIILPISIILGIYIDGQIDTLRLQISYDSKLENATYDALKTFQLNTINNTESDIQNSKTRDIEASVNSFFDSIASNFNMDGYNKDILKEYVPALVYTMYDGYYIYSDYTNKISEQDYKIPSEEEKSEGIEQSTYIKDEKLSGLKSYVYYSCRYNKDDLDIVINYSLDNYITIKGIKGTTVIDISGYLIDNIDGDSIENIKYRGIEIPPEELIETVVDKNRK